MENTREQTKKRYEIHPTESLQAIFNSYAQEVEPRRGITANLFAAAAYVPLAIEVLSTFASKYYNNPQIYERSDTLFWGSMAFLGLSALFSLAYRNTGTRKIEEQTYWDIRKILTERKNEEEDNITIYSDPRW